MFNNHLSKSRLMKMVFRSTLATQSFPLPSSSMLSSTVIPHSQELSSMMVIPLCKSLQDCSLESFFSVLSKSIKVEKSTKFWNQQKPQNLIPEHLPDCDWFTSWSVCFFLAITSASSFLSTSSPPQLPNCATTLKPLNDEEDSIFHQQSFHAATRFCSTFRCWSARCLSMPRFSHDWSLSPKNLRLKQLAFKLQLP